MTSDEATTDDGSMVTAVTSLISRPGHERFVRQEFQRVFHQEGRSPYHLATLLIQQENGLSFLISQFRSRQSLEYWKQTPQHQLMIEHFEKRSLRQLCIVESPVAIITVPSDASGPKWKSLITTWTVTFPLLLATINLLSHLAPDWTLLARIALTSILMSAAITYIISPFVLRLTRTWRLRNQQAKMLQIGPGYCATCGKEM